VAAFQPESISESAPDESVVVSTEETGVIENNEISEQLKGKFDKIFESFKKNHPGAEFSELKSYKIGDYRYHTCELDGNEVFFDNNAALIKDNFKIDFIKEGINLEGETAKKIFDAIGERGTRRKNYQ